MPPSRRSVRHSASDLHAAFQGGLRDALDGGAQVAGTSEAFLVSIPRVIAARERDRQPRMEGIDDAREEGRRLGAVLAVATPAAQAALLDEEVALIETEQEDLVFKETLMTAFREGLADGFSMVDRQPHVPADLLDRIPRSIAVEAKMRTEDFAVANFARMRGVWSGVAFAQASPSRLQELWAFEQAPSASASVVPQEPAEPVSLSKVSVPATALR